jgi:hypothetical protein
LLTEDKKPGCKFELHYWPGHCSNKGCNQLTNTTVGTSDPFSAYDKSQITLANLRKAPSVSTCLYTSVDLQLEQTSC